jgi:predicted GIY-YIG superfamily endonuclease
MTTALYRFFDKAGQLLYIGISNCIPRRLDQHEDTKPWFTEASQITVEHHPTRLAALAKEKKAIKAERPKYNIQHNRMRSGFTAATSTTLARPRWTFRSRRSDVARSENLFLYGELDCSAMVDEVYDLDGEGQLTAYIQYVARRYPEWLEADAVPIDWSVVGDGGIFEYAPFQRTEPDEQYPQEDFLSVFTLPVQNVRFPEFAVALGWTPAPLQPACPLRSVLDSRAARVQRPKGWEPAW